MLGVLVGGVGAMATAILSRADPVLAEGETIRVGGEYPTARSTTLLKNTRTTQTVFRAVVDNDSELGGTAIEGASKARFGGVGVRGSSTAIGGHGVWASGQWVALSASGGLYAIETTKGNIHFEGVSGLAVIGVGATSVTVEPEGMMRDSFVLLTPQTGIAGRDLWASVADDRFTIHLSRVASKRTTVAWLLLAPHAPGISPGP